jgi:hypothetical protein
MRGLRSMAGIWLLLLLVCLGAESRSQTPAGQVIVAPPFLPFFISTEDNLEKRSLYSSVPTSRIAEFSGDGAEFAFYSKSINQIRGAVRWSDDCILALPRTIKRVSRDKDGARRMRLYSRADGLPEGDSEFSPVTLLAVPAPGPLQGVWCLVRQVQWEPLPTGQSQMLLPQRRRTICSAAKN